MRNRKKVKSCVALNLVLTLLITGVGGSILLKAGHQHNCQKSREKYAVEINDYDIFVQDYAKYINSLNLESDIDIFIKVIKDIWDSIEGYGVAENLPTGYYRLAFQEEGKGVCSSFADDFTARINAINPLYNAENMYVYLNKDKAEGDIPTVEFERNVIKGNSDSSSNENILQKILGNHMVTVLTLPGKDVKLIVDSTNLFIGLFKDGKIEILNSSDNDFMEYKSYVNMVCSEESVIKDVSEYFETYDSMGVNIDELRKTYSYESQQKAYDKISNIVNKPQVLSKTLR